MTRDEAQHEADRLAREHPDRKSHHWFARERAGGEWSVVRVAVPDWAVRGDVKASVEAKPRPQQADDPRMPMERLIPPYGAGGAG